ncbi:MAG: vitamin K epoxide reductase family protein [Longimicrobiales bacterium]|nr:vitamin K epoxide reductase family protein [Longimicrobiales bacterium]
MSHGNRMVVAALALVGVFVATYLLLYKIGALGSIVCGTGGCETVQNSPWAYFLGVPVAAWGLVGYVAIFATAFLGTQPRFADAGWVPIGLLAFTGIAFLFSIYLSALEEFVIHAWCQWCIVSAVLSTLAFGFALPELRKARA